MCVPGGGEDNLAVGAQNVVGELEGVALPAHGGEDDLAVALELARGKLEGAPALLDGL